MSLNPNSVATPQHPGLYRTTRNQGTPVVLVVEDHLDARAELNEVLELNGYNVIKTDNGQDAARHARQILPDLLLVDLDVPLLFGLVAARQILKQSQLWQLPVVIVTHEDVIDSRSIMEVGSRRNEYVTRLADYDQIQDLLDYLLPVLPAATAHEPNSSSSFRTEAIEHLARSASPDAFEPTGYQ